MKHKPFLARREGGENYFSNRFRSWVGSGKKEEKIFNEFYLKLLRCCLPLKNVEKVFCSYYLHASVNI